MTINSNGEIKIVDPDLRDALLALAGKQDEDGYTQLQSQYSSIDIKDALQEAFDIIAERVVIQGLSPESLSKVPAEDRLRAVVEIVSAKTTLPEDTQSRLSTAAR